MKYYIIGLLIFIMQAIPYKVVAQTNNLFEKPYPSVILKDSVLYHYAKKLSKISAEQMDKERLLRNIGLKSLEQHLYTASNYALIFQNGAKHIRWIKIDSLVGYSMKDVKNITLSFHRHYAHFTSEAPFGIVKIELKNDSTVNSNYLSESLKVINLGLANLVSHYRRDADPIFSPAEFFEKNIAFYYDKGKMTKKPLDSLIRANDLQAVNVYLAPLDYDARNFSNTYHLEPFIMFSKMPARKRKKLKKAMMSYRQSVQDQQIKNVHK